MSGKSDFQLVSVSEEFYFSLVGKSENPLENVWLLQVLASAWASLCLDEGSGGWSLPVAFVSCFLLHVREGMLTLLCLHPIAWGRGGNWRGGLPTTFIPNAVKWIQTKQRVTSGGFEFSGGFPQGFLTHLASEHLFLPRSSQCWMLLR